MKVQCPNCGETVTVVFKGIGRKPLNIPRKNVCDALRTHHSVADAAQELGCSPAYIFGVLKTNDLKLKDVINNQAKPVTMRVNNSNRRYISLDPG